MRNDPVVPCGPDDILDAIHDIGARQSTCFVSIHLLGTTLNLHSDDDRTWLIEQLKKLDDSGRVGLSPVERPQALLSASQPWCVRNALGVLCHEVAAVDPDRRKTSPLSALGSIQDEAREGYVPEREIHGSVGKHGGLPSNAMPPPPWPLAKDASTNNPTVAQRRISELVLGAAMTLAGLNPCGRAPRVLGGTSNLEAA